MRIAAAEVHAADAFALGQGILVQEIVAGFVEHAQAVFRGGQLIAMQAYRQVLAGAGGGCGQRKCASAHGAYTSGADRERLAWNGALSVDYILPA
jgi:hypothetical protein